MEIPPLKGWKQHRPINERSIHSDLKIIIFEIEVMAQTSPQNNLNYSKLT